ncbi:hypothetical protein GON09_005328 [Rhodococcus sp. B50]|nr:hypothetical protein [Rhodococcus sp. B50]
MNRYPGPGADLEVGYSSLPGFSSQPGDMVRVLYEDLGRRRAQRRDEQAPVPAGHHRRRDMCMTDPSTSIPLIGRVRSRLSLQGRFDTDLEEVLA